ncbi:MULTISPECIES: DUF4232 domain-containing protein [Streptomyces]|uniref:DUF4232 domain-containing protein n=1 Tax=Streptomyces scabiei TaxID=1930 RepID=UPI0004E6CB52|nr:MULTISPECIES: DUF4232 domain-containing protein [Streptomyces]MBP5872372.1 DUF4232 domain-containing protein [Streptomyces sp. LBUM 1485]KFG04290.1 hypothetical protein IQ61_36580 [Streptomyces scabiei]MDX2831390.1 DUF4232 domain-containing protein [Streptomyces scabiei]MDX3033650.1 DUF4232 domain-containing protein [Streptomyces scabiei]MDX3205508.1 DUF4232 domain-containing protein [Streptomyces scabiei]
MRTRSFLTVSTVATAGAALLIAAAPQGLAAQPAATTPVCKSKVLKLAAKQAKDTRVVHISVKNTGTRTCTIDRLPVVTFGDLDGAAQPVPSGESGPYKVGAGKTVYAAVRTIADLKDPEARRVDTVTVSANPNLDGRTFTLKQLGASKKVKVWEPVTTWWKPSKAAADKALEKEVG